MYVGVGVLGEMLGWGGSTPHASFNSEGQDLDCRCVPGWLRHCPLQEGRLSVVHGGRGLCSAEGTHTAAE